MTHYDEKCEAVDQDANLVFVFLKDIGNILIAMVDYVIAVVIILISQHRGSSRVIYQSYPCEW